MKHVTRPWLSEGEKYIVKHRGAFNSFRDLDKVLHKGLLTKDVNPEIRKRENFIPYLYALTERGKQIARQLGAVIS